jgi:Mu transposase, C-terminal domain
VTGWRASLRLPRDYYLRRDTNDYSVDPAVIGRRIEVVAHPQRVRAFCDGKLVAVRERVWARRQRPPLARQRVQGEVDVLVCRVQVERGTDPTSANGRPYPSRREHYCKLPQPGHRKEMASIPWGKGIEAIVFHTIVDERRVITIHASRGP